RRRSRSLRLRRRGRSGRRSRRGWLRGASGSPCGGALVEERAQALLPFRARAQLGGEPRRLLASRSLADELLRRPRGLRPCAQELAGDELDRRIEVRGDFVDDADPKRGLGIEALARQEKAPRCGGTDSREDER